MDRGPPRGAGSFDEVTFSEVLESAGIVDPVVLAGVQNKASAWMRSLPVGHIGKRFILKVDLPEYPHVVVNEAYFFACAARFGYPVVSMKLVHDSAGRSVLLVERCDRITGPDGTGVALAVEDGTQVMTLNPADKVRRGDEDLTTALPGCAQRVWSHPAPSFGRFASGG